ncbi:hypothetical protein JCM18901_564 [Psychrobacter sp. JCM 18901]|nr:hypothetical protein JCM18901_564 [Psychrobacter sp. JCM 18901]
MSTDKRVGDEKNFTQWSILEINGDQNSQYIIITTKKTTAYAVVSIVDQDVYLFYKNTIGFIKYILSKQPTRSCGRLTMLNLMS